MNVVSGRFDPAFTELSNEFERNFLDRGEVGASVCVYQHGKKVVDLWGGVRDPAGMLAWEADTIVCTMSVSKGLAALCALILVDRGLLDLDAPVARWWPEFARAGKSQITVRQLVGGMAGLVLLEHADGAFFDWDAMIGAIERQQPQWEPGTRGAYHSMTYGHLLGELVRRADGRPIERILQEEIAGPLGADFRYGVAEADCHRLSDLIPNDASTTLNAIVTGESLLGRAWKVLPPVQGPFFNSEPFRQSVLPTGNGHGNARGLARIFAMLAQRGSLDGIRILSEQAIELARSEQWNGSCGLTGRHYRYGLGFFLNQTAGPSFGRNPQAFGHPGAGGAVAFADPEGGIAFAYTPNFMCAGESLGDRCDALIEATYASLSGQNGASHADETNESC